MSHGPGHLATERPAFSNSRWKKIYERERERERERK